MSGRITPTIEQQVADGLRPKPDYLQLGESFHADLLDYDDAHADRQAPCRSAGVWQVTTWRWRGRAAAAKATRSRSSPTASRSAPSPRSPGLTVAPGM